MLLSNAVVPRAARGGVCPGAGRSRSPKSAASSLSSVSPTSFQGCGATSTASATPVRESGRYGMGQAHAGPISWHPKAGLGQSPTEHWVCGCCSHAAVGGTQRHIMVTGSKRHRSVPVRQPPPQIGPGGPGCSAHGPGLGAGWQSQPPGTGSQTHAGSPVQLHSPAVHEAFTSWKHAALSLPLRPVAPTSSEHAL